MREFQNKVWIRKQKLLLFCSSSSQVVVSEKHVFVGRFFASSFYGSKRFVPLWPQRLKVYDDSSWLITYCVKKKTRGKRDFFSLNFSIIVRRAPSRVRQQTAQAGKFAYYYSNAAEGGVTLSKFLSLISYGDYLLRAISIVWNVCAPITWPSSQ